MDRKIRVGVVSYLNTKPLLYGIRRSSVLEDIELIVDYPSKIATMLLEDEIDLGLVPVAIIPQMKEYYLIGDYCISSDGPVASVCLFSERPIEEIRTILLDYQSRTSVQMARILVRKYWKIDPEFIDAGEEFRMQIKGAVAAVVVGDRALEQRRISPYIFDLGEAWKNFTGLPFVYAAWISNKELDPEFQKNFNEANAFGLKHVDELIREQPFQLYDLATYFSKNISYEFTAEKRKGMALFLELLKEPQGYTYI
ncbi:MAG: menaquinone biosynthetic enzyme MqnA/MqnD family protein [Chitinophagales bacterium]